MAKVTPIRPKAASEAGPRYELRMYRHGPGDHEMAVFQVRSPLTPHIVEPVFIGGLRGAALERFEPRILRLLRRHEVRIGPGQPGRRNVQDLGEEPALILGLLFRTLAPMRNRDYMEVCLTGIERMSREEAAYWLGMVMHRRKPRRILMALRIVLNASDG
mgnify:CR=1 FL=1